MIRDFHPLVFFYMLGFLMTAVGLGLGIALIVLRSLGYGITAATVVLVALLLVSGSQFALFAMWFDMEVEQGPEVGPRPGSNEQALGRAAASGRLARPTRRSSRSR